MPEYAKDVMIGVLGASVGLGGLLLIFCGFIFSVAAGYPTETTSDATIQMYKRAGRLGLWPFVGSLVNALVVVVWFLCPCNVLYFIALALFILLLVITAAYGLKVMLKYM